MLRSVEVVEIGGVRGENPKSDNSQNASSMGAGL